TGPNDTTAFKSDRGTYYNYFDGTNWLSQPNARIEPVYSGYPANVFTGNGGEWLSSNNSYHSLSGIMTRPAKGTGSWTYKDSSNQRTLWPRAVAWGNNIH